MRSEYDPKSGCWYLYLQDIPDGGVAYSKEATGAIILDFDSDDKLIGIEVLDAPLTLSSTAIFEADTLRPMSRKKR